MKRKVGWPGRGPIWLVVPGLIVAVCGAIVLLEVLPRQNLSRELLEAGHFAIADTTQVDVARGSGNPTVAGVHASFQTADGGWLQTPLVDYEDDAQGMAQGLQTPPPGTRYAVPLQIIYRPAAPQQAVALVDARQWAADQRTPLIGIGMVAGGLTIALIAAAGLIRDLYRRGLARWRWYVEGPYLTSADR